MPMHIYQLTAVWSPNRIVFESDKDSSGGVQVVKRPSPTFQKELGEPAFSPDGNYLYYTQNVSPGNMFVYRQDSNKEIFQIKRV
ncbi:hypothetical protein OAR95_04700, partial [Pseudomonadales bacterium]|nr:hypothetical protein [Pseudomonadales bacterium]